MSLFLFQYCFGTESPEISFKEFPGECQSPECADKPPKWLYQQLILRKLCKSIEWRQVPLSRSNLGPREGSPGVFYKNGYVFIFGGWGLGPMRDLHVAALQAPMHFREVMIQGSGPAPTYEAKITVLDEGTNSVFRVIVTGGWRHGGRFVSVSACVKRGVNTKQYAKRLWEFSMFPGLLREPAILYYYCCIVFSPVFRMVLCGLTAFCFCFCLCLLFCF